MNIQNFLFNDAPHYITDHITEYYLKYQGILGLFVVMVATLLTKILGKWIWGLLFSEGATKAHGYGLHWLPSRETRQGKRSMLCLFGVSFLLPIIFDKNCFSCNNYWGMFVWVQVNMHLTICTNCEFKVRFWHVVHKAWVSCHFYVNSWIKFGRIVQGVCKLFVSWIL